ncbi:hypothetical protein MTO96_019808 [Rhipicephalus appendiculatus]
MERLLRRRKCLRSQLDAITQEAEGLLREPQLPSSQVSVSIDRISVINAQITKIDESLVNETPEDLIETETLDASNYGDKIVTLTSKLRFAIQNDRDAAEEDASLGSSENRAATAAVASGESDLLGAGRDCSAMLADWPLQPPSLPALFVLHCDQRLLCYPVIEER